MRVGCARIDITPALPAPLAGQPFDCRAKGVALPLHLCAMRLEDGGSAALIMGADVLEFPVDLTAELRGIAARAAEVPPECVLLAASHTHSAPSLAPVLGAECDAGYARLVRDRVRAAAAAALQIAQPAMITAQSGAAPGLAFNRRFIMSDGTVETHPLKSNPHIVRPEGPDSSRLWTLMVRDQGGRPLGTIMNFGCHATVMERRNTAISADYPGYAQSALMARTGAAPAMFLQGAAGNICQVNPLDSSRREVGAAWAQFMGESLAAAAWRQMECAEPGQGRLRAARAQIRLPRRTIPAELLAWARQHSRGQERRPMPRLSDYGVEMFGSLPPDQLSLADFMRSAYWAGFYAREIQDMAVTCQAAPMVDFEMAALAQDNWALVFLPCELFAEWGEALARASPFKHTGVVTLANGCHGYLPTRRAFDRAGGYETMLLSSTFLAPEAGDMMFGKVSAMLAELHSRVNSAG